MKKVPNFPMPRSRRTGWYRVRLFFYIVVIALSFSWYGRAHRAGHPGPAQKQLRELRAAEELAVGNVDKLSVLEKIIAASQHNPAYEFQESFAWATMRKAGLLDDSEVGERLLEEVVDTYYKNMDFGLQLIAEQALRQRVQNALAHDGWMREDEALLAKYSEYASDGIRRSLHDLWRKKLKSTKEKWEKAILLTEYRGWLESRPLRESEIHLVWAIGEQAEISDDMDVKIALFEEIDRRFSRSKNDYLLGYVVWSMWQKAGLLRDSDARLAIYRDIDDRYKDNTSRPVTRQVAHALSLQAGLLDGEERLRLFDEIHLRYADYGDEWVTPFLERISQKKAALVRKMGR